MNAFYNQKTVLVTGAASGIGRLLAEKLFYLNARLVLWDIDNVGLEEVKDDLGNSDQLLIQEIDVTDTEKIGQLADSLIEEDVIPDILVNNAGIVVGKKFVDHTPDEIHRTMMINTESLMQITLKFLPEMIKKGNGNIVNISSASGYIGNPNMSIYASSKWAVTGWSESLRLEMKKYKTGVCVTTVIPSYVDTGMFRGVTPPKLIPMMQPEELVNKIIVGVRKQKSKVQAPLMVQFVPLLKALLPTRLFDWLAERVFRVYHSMDTYKGRS